MNFNLSLPQAAVISTAIITTGITGGLVSLNSDNTSSSKNYATVNYDGGYSKIGIIYDENVYSEATVVFDGRELSSGNFETVKTYLNQSIATNKTAETTNLTAGVVITANTGIEWDGSRKSFRLETDTFSQTSTNLDRINVAGIISKFDEMLEKTEKNRKKTSKKSLSYDVNPGSSNEWVAFLEKLMELGNNYLPY